MNKARQKRWEKIETAQKYDEYAQRLDSIYKKTSSDLVNIAKIKKGMVIIDLACGTGITTEKILKRIKGTGKIYAVDASLKMVEIAKKKIKNDNVVFVHSSAEKINKVIKEKADMVISNSAFWQMNTDKTLSALNSILKNDGKFIFNLPQQFFIFSQKPKDDLISSSFRRLAVEIAIKKYGFSPSNKKLSRRNLFNIRKIREILEDNNFVLDFYKIINYKRTPKDIYEFYKIPNFAENLLPGLSYEKKVNILNTAFKQLNIKTEYSNNKWIYFVARKKGFS